MCAFEASSVQNITGLLLLLLLLLLMLSLRLCRAIDVG